DEDPRADHRSDDEGGGVEPGDRLDEVGLRLLGRGHWRRKLVAPAKGRYVLPLDNPNTRGRPCASCPVKKSSSTCSSTSSSATRSRPSICGSCSTPPPSAASPTSRRSSDWSTRPTRSRTKW